MVISLSIEPSAEIVFPSYWKISIAIEGDDWLDFVLFGVAWTSIFVLPRLVVSPKSLDALGSGQQWLGQMVLFVQSEGTIICKEDFKDEILQVLEERRRRSKTEPSERY